MDVKEGTQSGDERETTPPSCCISWQIIQISGHGLLWNCSLYLAQSVESAARAPSEQKRCPTVSKLEGIQCGLASGLAPCPFFLLLLWIRVVEHQKQTRFLWGTSFSRYPPAVNISTPRKWPHLRLCARVCKPWKEALLTQPPHHQQLILTLQIKYHQKGDEIDFIHEMTLEHAISDCTRSQTVRSAYQANIDR